MKCLLMITGLISWATIFGQGNCYNMKVESIVVAKPCEGSIVSATATSLVLGWKGSTDENYIASILFTDAVEPATINTVSAPGIRSSGDYYTAIFPVTPGMVINWHVQAIKTLDGRLFYSYPLRSNEAFIIPDEVSTASTTKHPNSTGNKLPATEEDKIKVKLYPNPVHSILHLNVSSVVKTLTTQARLIRVVDISGKTVLIQKTGFGIVQVNVSKLSNAAYFIRVEDAGGKLLYIAKFLKE